jgi:2-dehydro-3-deoxygluconokinase
MTTRLLQRKGRIVCFGEILLRLAAPRGEMLLQSPALQVSVGGSEANVAVALACAGVPATMVSVLPDNALGTAARNELRRYGVDVSGLRFAAGRMGLYFLTSGAVLRPTEVEYDRAHSAFSLMSPDLIDWIQEFDGASRLHVSGINLALGTNVASTTTMATRAATRLGVPISVDGNYRRKLWGSDSRAPTMLRDLVAVSETAFLDHRDIALLLGRPEYPDTPTRNEEMAADAFRSFPSLCRIAFTHRVTLATGRQELTSFLIPRNGQLHSTATRTLEGIVDRVGAGDAFAAGVLLGLWQGLDDKSCLELGMASTCLKHSIHGDASLATLADLASFQDGLMEIRR